jgi:hypothetical protein
MQDAFPDTLLDLKDESFLACQWIPLRALADELQRVLADALLDELPITRLSSLTAHAFACLPSPALCATSPQGEVIRNVPSASFGSSHR